MNKESRICVIGPGAIGGVVAAVLTRQGYDTTLVVKHPELAEKISKKGIEVLGECGEFTIPVPSVALPEELTGYIASKGRELGVATPVNEKLTRMVEEIEQGKRKIHPANFEEI